MVYQQKNVLIYTLILACRNPERVCKHVREETLSEIVSIDAVWNQSHCEYYYIHIFILTILILMSRTDYIALQFNDDLKYNPNVVFGKRNRIQKI